MSKYGKIYRTESFSVSDASKLKELGQKYMTRNYKDVPMKYSIKAIDLKDLNPSVRAFHVGDKVRILSTPHGVDQTVECLSIEIKMDDPGATSYELGDPDESFSERYDKSDRQNSNGDADAASSARTAAGNTSKLYRTIKEQGMKLMIDADEISVNAKNIKVNADKIEIHAEIIDAHEAKLSVYQIDGDLAWFSTALGSNRVIADTVDVKSTLLMNGRSVSPYAITVCTGGSVSVSVWGDTDTSGHYVKSTSGSTVYAVSDVWVDVGGSGSFNGNYSTFWVVGYP